MVKKVLFWSLIFKIEILIDLDVLRSPKSENHIFSERCALGRNEKINFQLFICDRSEKVHFGADMISLKYEKY